MSEAPKLTVMEPGAVVCVAGCIIHTLPTYGHALNSAVFCSDQPLHTVSRKFYLPRCDGRWSRDSSSNADKCRSITARIATQVREQGCFEIPGTLNTPLHLTVQHRTPDF